MSIELAQLRKQLRKQRRQVSAYQQQQSELQILQRLRRVPEFKHATRVGIYLHAFGEIQTHKIIEYCFHQKKSSVFTDDLQYESALSVGQSFTSSISK